MRIIAATTADQILHFGQYREGMARRRSMAPRLAFAVLAVVAIVAMHGSSAEAHTCHPVDHVMEPHGDRDHTGQHDPTGPSSTAPPHCGSVACTAVVAPRPQPGATRVANFASIQPEQHRSPSGTPVAPEPPVPRSSLHL